MARYVGGRLVTAVVLALGVASLAFVLLWIAPGDADDALLLGGNAAAVRAGGATPGLPSLYVSWLADLARGDLGVSASGLPVSRILAAALPHTVALAVAGLIVAALFGVSLGVMQAARAGSAFDRLAGVATTVLYATPSFWVGIVLLEVLVRGPSAWGFTTGLPLSGVAPPGGARSLSDYVPYLILPALTLGLVLGAGVARYTRASMVEILRQDFIRGVRARGVGEGSVLLRHALRNALLPLISLMGLYLPMLLTGAVFVEAVFSRPGVGREMLQAIARQDTAVVVGGALLFGLASVMANLVADLLYGWADPRIADGHRA